MKRKMFCITSFEFLLQPLNESFCCNVIVEVGVSVRRISLIPVVSCLSSVPTRLVR